MRRVNEAVVYIAGWTLGVIAVVIFLSYFFVPKSMGVMFGLTFWGFAGYFGGVPGWNRVREWRFGREDIRPVALMTLFWPFAFVGSYINDAGERLMVRDVSHERRNRRLIVAGFFYIVLWGWIIGTGIILQLEPGWFILAIMAGPALIVTSAWLYRRMRRQYADLVRAGRWDRALRLGAEALALAVIGSGVIAATLLNA